MKSLYEEMNGSYIGLGDVKVPTIVSIEANCEIGFWGRKHKKYLKESHRVIYYNLLTQGKLNLYLHKIDTKTNKQYELLIKQLPESQGITKQFKTDNQMLWVQMMSNIANQAREIIYSNIVFNI